MTLQDSMTKLRKFRHVIMHGYSFTLDPTRVHQALTDIPRLTRSFEQEVERYVQAL